jgi:acetyl-CoA C-acetyltransferase
MTKIKNNNIKNKIAILGVGSTQYGELWHYGIGDLIAQAQIKALDDSGVNLKEIDNIYVANMCGEIFSGQAHLGALASNILGLSVPAARIEAACASGGVAIMSGIQAILSGMSQVVMVTGVEKMTDVDPAYAATALMGAGLFDYEHFTGATFPALFGLITRLYTEKYKITREQLAQISVKNHANGVKNPLAHIRKEITVQDVLRATVIASPLTLLDCAPISDGASTVILSSYDFARKKNWDGFYIASCASATDTLALAQRESLLEFKATQKASALAYSQARITPKDIDIAEVHDAFSTSEIISRHDLGFCAPGAQALNIKRPVINSTGGLKSRGHPVGATGVGQLVDIVNQLRGTAGQCQIPGVKVGLTHNMGGAGVTVVVNIIRGI